MFSDCASSGTGGVAFGVICVVLSIFGDASRAAKQSESGLGGRKLEYG